MSLVTYVLDEAQYSQFLQGLVSVTKEISLPSIANATKPLPRLTSPSLNTENSGSSTVYAIFVESTLAADAVASVETTNTAPNAPAVLIRTTAAAELTNSVAERIMPTEPPNIVTLGGDGIAYTPTWRLSTSSYTQTPTSKFDSPTMGGMNTDGKNESTPSKATIAAVAIGGVIALLLLMSLLLMYCVRRRSAKLKDYLHRTRGVPGLSKRIHSEKASLRGTSPVGSFHRPSLSSFFGVSLGFPVRSNNSKSPNKVLLSQVEHGAATTFGNEPSPSLPVLLPISQKSNEAPQTRHPGNTTATYLNALSKKHVTWQDQLFQDQSFVTLPPLTRSASTHTMFTYGSDSAKSLGLETVDDGTPLPEPPSRPATSVQGTHRGPSYSIFPSPQRSSGSARSQGSAPSGFYNLPAGESSALTATTCTDSPVPTNLSAPPPLNAYPPLFSLQTTDPSGRTEAIGRLASVYGSGLGFLRGSQAASSQYNSVIADSNSDYESVSAYSAYNNEDIIPGLSYKDVLSNEEARTQPLSSTETRPGNRGTHNTFTSSVGEGALEGMRYLARTLSETFASATTNAKSTTLSLLGGSSTLTPTGRQSSLRGSGIVYSSKPSLVSLNESGQGLEAAVTGSIVQDTHDITFREGSREERIGSYTSFPPPDFGTPAQRPKHSRQPSSGPTTSITPVMSVESIPRCASLSESITSVSSTGSSILYVHGGGLDIEIRKERISKRDKSAGKPTTRCLTQRAESTALRKFGPSQSMKTEVIVAAGFSFPSPWVRELTPSKQSRSAQTYRKGYQLEHSQRPPLNQEPDRATIPDTTLPRSSEFVPSRHTLPQQMHGGTVGMNAERKVMEESGPTMGSLIHELQKGSVDCSSSSIYSSGSISSSNNGANCKTSGSLDRSLKSRTSVDSSTYISDSFLPDSNVFSNSSNSSSSSAKSLDAEFNFPFAPAPSPCLSLVPSSASSSSIQSITYQFTPPPPPSPVHVFPTLPLLQFHPLMNHTPTHANTNNPQVIEIHPPEAPSPINYHRHHIKATNNNNNSHNNNDTQPPRPKTRGKHTTNRSINFFDTSPLGDNTYSPTMSMVNFYTSLNAAATSATTPNSTTSSPARKPPTGHKSMSMLVLPQRISAFFGRKTAAQAATAGAEQPQGSGYGNDDAGFAYSEKGMRFEV